MINNKKVFLLYIVFFFIFLTFLLFPKYGNYTKLYSFFIKEKLETPFGFVGLKINNFYSLFQSNKVHLKNIDQLEKENKYLININNYLTLVLSGLNSNLFEGENEFLKTNETVDISFVKIPYSSIPDSLVNVTNSEISNYIFTVILAGIIAISIKMIGVLLITGLLLIPPAMSRNFSTSPIQMMIISIIGGILSVVIGLFCSLELNTPSGPSIIVTSLMLFVISLFFKKGMTIVQKSKI